MNHIERIIKRNFIYFVIATLFITLCYLSLLRLDDFYFADDHYRKNYGTTGYTIFSRYTAELLSVIFTIPEWHAYNYTPLEQVLAICVMAFSGLILNRLFVGKITIFSAIISALVGMSPFFYGNLLFSYGSLSMSLSVLFSILPFLFYRSVWLFLMLSILGILGTLTTYQSASGIYWVIVIMLTAKSYFYDQINIKKCFKLFCIATLAYVIAVVIFRFCIYTPRFSHISNEALALPELFNGIIRNIKKYLVFIYSFVTKGYIGLYIVFLLLIYPLNVLRCQKNQFKVISMICLLAITPVVLIASIGIPIFLSEFPLADRYMLGFNVFITICALVGFLNSGIIYRIFYLLFAMQLIAYGNIQGNIIGEQWSYEKFRLSMALSDLSPLIDDEYALSFGGNPVFRASFNVNAKSNSFIYGRHKKIISLLGYPGYWQLIVGRYIPIRKGNVQCDSDKGEVIFSSVYHDIYQKDRCFSVIYKTVGVKQSSIEPTLQTSLSIMNQSM